MSSELSREEPNTSSVLLRVEDDLLRLPEAIDREATYDVLLNGGHVWSLQPDRDTRTEDGVLVAPWPKALRRYLVGRADVSLRHHVSGAVVGTAEHVFGGDDTKKVEVADREGRSLVLDKWGRLTRPMSAEDDTLISDLMDQVVRLLDVLRDEAGVPAYICYGTLLGAVRNGRLIGHDNDIDIAYVSEHPTPVDVARESYRVERTLRDAGWFVRRGSGVRLNVRLKLGDNTMRFVDVFTSHWVEGVLYIPSDTGFRLPKETILPLSTVELLGRQVPAPAQPERLLAATYGENWRVPDPSFKYSTPRWLSRRLGGWFGGLMAHRKHWDGFMPKARRHVRGPSPFAQWVAAEYPSTRPLVDLGTGTGRDALWFARHHHRRTIGIDYSVGGIHRGNRISHSNDLPATFEIVNLYDLRAVLALGARLSREQEPVDLYARFTLHALEWAGRDNLFRLASMALRRGGLLFLEFRTPKDRERPHVFDGPRNYLPPAAVTRHIEGHGGRVVHLEEGTGLAPFQDEDPYVCRMVVSWSASPTDRPEGR